MDRFDCQYLMATFVNVYIASFIRYLLLCGEVWGPCQTQVTHRLVITQTVVMSVRLTSENARQRGNRGSMKGSIF